MSNNAPDYSLTIDLNTLNHLGIGLYSNIPAVISEVVSNSWDADADNVSIQIDVKSRTITIEDDGWGMTKTEINQKYLRVGYSKRDKENSITPKNRHVMGRKGIGKLSLFSIADTIEVHSVKTDGKGQVVEKNGFVMKTAKIKETIEQGNATYNPESVESSRVVISRGTRIILTNLKNEVDTTAIWLRRRLARRFSIIGSRYGFTVKVDDQEIDVTDRDYFSKIEYLWCIGEDSDLYKQLCKNKKRDSDVSGVVDSQRNYKISGWVGTFARQDQIEEGDNTIVITAWGKLIHEDILKDLKEGGVFTKYLIGEVRADFLDDDKKEDIATSDRQSLKETDPRFKALKDYIQTSVLKLVQSKWRDWRKEDATDKALTNPRIKDWFETLTSDNKKHAKTLFGKIESLPLDDDNKKELYKHGILAFETLALTDKLSTLDRLETSEDITALLEIYKDLDALEAVHYYQITKSRVRVLEQFEKMLPKSKERAIQLFIFDHLWLLSPTWERASTDARMEESVEKEFKKVTDKLTEEERKGRLDIKYRTAAGKHIIIELKKFERVVRASELTEQVDKYRRALEKCLKATHPDQQHYDIEIICIVGPIPEPRDSDNRNRDALKAYSARYITYEELIQQTRDSYREYLDKQKDIDRIRELIESL